MTITLPASEYERDDPRVIVIGNKEIAQYVYSIMLRFQYHDEIVLHYMPFSTSIVVRILDLYKQFGIVETRGSRKEVLVKGKNGEPLTIREVLIRKPGMLLP